MPFENARQMIISHDSENGGSGEFGSIVAVITVLAIVGSVIYLSWRVRGSKKWDEGFIPDHFKATPDNIFEIFICAACAIIARDPARLYIKFGMVNRYMKEHFPEEYYDFEDSYRFSLKHIVKIDSLVAWCNKNFETDRRIQLVNFLLQIAIDDGELLEDEKQYIFALISKLKLHLEDIDPELSAKLVEQHQQTAPTPRENDFTFYETLGLAATATIQEVKSAYRKLAKMTHPDRYSLEPSEIQEQMKIRFQRIQEAYEAILTKSN